MTTPTKVHELLVDPSHWTKGYYARTADGGKCGITSPEAQSYCLFGAILKVYGDQTIDGRDAYLMIDEKVRSALGARGQARSIVCWNDDPSRTHDEVLTLCKELDI